jgi:hypothetical protein
MTPGQRRTFLNRLYPRLTVQISICMIAIIIERCIELALLNERVTTTAYTPICKK